MSAARGDTSPVHRQNIVDLTDRRSPVQREMYAHQSLGSYYGGLRRKRMLIWWIKDGKDAGMVDYGGL